MTMEDNGKLFNELESALAIDKDGLDDALTQQHDLMYRVEKHLNALISNRDNGEQRLKECEAEIDIELREDARKSKDAKEGKITENEIKALKVRDKAAAKIAKDVLEMNRLIGQWSALLHAYQQRSYALGHLVNLYIKTNYTPDGSGSSPRREFQDNAHMGRRERMNEARQERVRPTR